MPWIGVVAAVVGAASSAAGVAYSIKKGEAAKKEAEKQQKAAEEAARQEARAKALGMVPGATDAELTMIENLALNNSLLQSQVETLEDNEPAPSVTSSPLFPLALLAALYLLMRKK